MAPVTLEGDTLGKKRQHFNKLVEDAIANKKYELCNICGDDSDIENLLRINIASRHRNVDYIIEVMKCNDMLYAATAITKSTWLITDPQYSNIINPEYLHTQLLPSMNTKIFNKLKLHIRLNLKDERRVEAFYEYLTVTESAHKWLENCSIPFIEDVIKNKRLIPLSLFKRLCRRSAHFIVFYTRVVGHKYTVKQEILFLLKSHTENVLKVLEDDFDASFPVLGKKKSKILLKTHSQKVFDDFPTYVRRLDMAEVMKYIDKKETKTFLCNQVKRRNGHYLCYYDTLGYFFKNMPEEERFEFVKKTFIDKTDLAAFYEDYNYSYNWYLKPYQWYEFAPFDVALTEIKNFTRKEHPPSERNAMLSVLITCARRSQKHNKTLLEFFKDKYIKESFKFKIEFINNLLSQISTYEFDAETWNVLDQLFHNMEVYTESNNNVQQCLESIILYKVLHNNPVPVIIEQKVTFNTFEKIQNKLNKEQRNKLFNYLLNSVLKKIQSENIVKVSNLVETVIQLKNALTLLRDWKKDISDYPFILEKIQQLIKIRQENMWKTDISCLYNVQKSWRKHMFEESLSLCLNEEVCFNALKHKPQLLTRHDKEIDTLRTNDAVSLRRLLNKLRVYWPHSLAQHWIDAYLLHLNKATGQKAVVRGLFSLLHQRQIIEMAKNYIPDYSKVNWSKTDQNEISIRQNIAKHLHLARPLIPLDTVLWYATGDYLQHAVPSLNAVLSNMSEVESHEHLVKLLEAPVSLQKFGLHLAANKLKHDDQKRIFLKIWKTSKNSSIRSALVKHVYIQISLMAHNLNVQKELWEVLSSFIDNMSEEESAEIYKTFGNVHNVNIGIRGEFYMKSYEFLTTLPARANCENYVKDLIEYAPKIMDYLDEDFVANKMLSPARTKFCFYESELLEIFACYVLCGKTEEDQLRRFKRVVEPAMSEAFQLWGSTRAGHFYVKDNFKKFLSFLIWNFRIYFLTKKTLPVQLFLEIKKIMEKELPLLDNYVLYTSWKLITEYVKVMDQHKFVLSDLFDPSSFNELDFGKKKISKEMENIWININHKIAPTLGSIIVQCLKEDTEQYNIPTIYCLFAEAFERMFNDFSEDEEFMLETLKHMLDDKDFQPSYFLVSKATPKFVTSDMKKIICKIRLEIRAKLESHPSSAVRTHYYNDFRNLPRHYDF